MPRRKQKTSSARSLTRTQCNLFILGITAIVCFLPLHQLLPGARKLAHDLDEIIEAATESRDSTSLRKKELQTHVPEVKGTLAVAAEPKNHATIIPCTAMVEQPPEYLTTIRFNKDNAHQFDMSTHDPRKEIVSDYITRDGCYECDVLHSFLQAMKSSQTRHFFDMGGNIGMYSLFAAASLNVQVYVFEPFAANQEKICQTIQKNPHVFQTGDSKITLYGAAVTDSTKWVSFNLRGFTRAVRKPGELNYGTLIIQDIDSSNPPEGIQGKDYAQGVTLNSLQDNLPAPGSHVALKVDVEGSECVALTGGLEYLSKLTINYAAMEMTYVRLQICRSAGQLEPIFDLFEKNGLKLYLHNRDEQKWQEVSVTNWISWSRPLPSQFDLAWSKVDPNEYLAQSKTK